jgi:hypothetical protein
MAGLSACGGGPSGPGGGGAGSVSIAPNGLTLSVGGEGNLTADARDGSGATLPASAVTWSSLNTAVASVDTDGTVSGNNVGTTRVLATAAGASDSVTVVVTDLACNSIELVPQWHANLVLVYSDHGPVQPSADVHVQHLAQVAATLTLTGPPVGGFVEWTGELVHGLDVSDEVADTAVAIHEESSDMISDPTILVKLEGAGEPVPTPGVDGLRLRVDLASCTFQFIAAPSVHATLTITEHAVHTLPGPDEGTRTFEQDIPLGLLQDAFWPLGDWRTVQLGAWPAYRSFDSYSVLYVPLNTRAYIPSGEFGQTLFGFPPSPAPRDQIFEGRADAIYKFVPQLP